MLSVILPVHNEAESLEKIYFHLSGILPPLEVPFEIVFVNDGSTDDSSKILKQIKEKNHVVKIINLKRSYGQSNTLQAGIDNAKGEIIVTLDADLENDPRDIVHLLDKLSEGYDVVCGRRVGRPVNIKNMLSALGNFVFRLAFKSPVRDMACTLRAYKREALEKIVLHGSLHRYLPVLLHLKGVKIAEINVSSRLRKFGRSKYGILFRGISTLRDLFSLLFFREAVLNSKRRDYKIASIW